MGGRSWWGIHERRVSDRWEGDWGKRRRRDTWDVVAAQQNSSQWGQAASALLIASPCQTIFKQNLLMQCGPAYFCFYPLLVWVLFLSLSPPSFIFSSFHVLALFRGPPTRISSPGSVGGRYPVLPLRGKLFKQHPCLMLFTRKANDVWVFFPFLNIVINTYGFYVAWVSSEPRCSWICCFECVVISQSYNNHPAGAHKVHQTKCRRVFNYSVYLRSILAGLLSLWVRWECCLPTHHP